MQIRLLGHVEVTIDERPIPLGGSQQRAVLAMLGLEANRPVPASRLAAGLWGEQPPASASKMVQNYVWRLRGLLAGDGGAEIVTRGRGYALQIDPELIDSLRFERLVGAARRGDGDAARRALALFTGEPLADLADEPFAGAEIRRLEALRVDAAELAIDADLAAGRHHDVVAEIEGLLADHPLREALHAQLMLALYRCGRQAEALAAYRHARETLVEAIGIEPGPELQRLQAAILRQEPSLLVESPAQALPPELEYAAAAPLIGREREVAALRRLWRHTLAGERATVTIVGAFGMGKTRLVAELAKDVHAQGAPVVYIAASGPGEAALAALARASAAHRATLLIVDDADRAASDVQSALLDVRGPTLVLATGLQAAALARLEPRESIRLEPLGAEGVGAIAALYAPSGSEPPTAQLLAASRGVPRRVHEGASEWARRHATERVEALAGRTAAGRSETRALEFELAGSVAELQTTLRRIDARRASDRAVCPYKGLSSFDADDAEYFFGREALVAELVARLVGTRLLTIVGASGSGKSSVLRAGLLPALAGGVLPGSQHWHQTVIRPGEVLPEHDGGLLAVDQFEEVFTSCTEHARAELIAALLQRSRAVVVIRSDFYGRCAQYPELSNALANNHVLVGPMTREELRRAIDRPAQRAGLTVEPELTDALVADVEGEPGALPLLSTALLELWSRRSGQHLTIADYASSGGVHGAVARLAEDAYQALKPADQAAARTLFLRLSDEDDGGAIVRRRLALAEQDAGVVAELTARRLLTAAEGTVEVAHEALLREWPRLRAWLDEDAEGRRLHRRLRVAAQAWDADRREPGALYRGARLVAALDWAAVNDAELEPRERAFLDAGRREAGRAQRRLRAVLAAVASLLALASIAGLIALHQRNQAVAREADADARRLGAQAVAASDLDLSLLLARQAVALRDSAQTRGDLLAALLKSPAAIGAIRGIGTPSTLALAADGHTLVVTGRDFSLRTLDARTGRPAAPMRSLDTDADGVTLDRAGEHLVTQGDSPAVWDLRRWTALAYLPGAGAFMGSGAFSPDGRFFYAMEQALTSRVVRFDARTGARVGASRLLFDGLPRIDDVHSGAVLTLPGGDVVTLVDGRLAVRDARTLLPHWTFTDASVGHVAAGPDGRTLLLGGADGDVAFVDLASRTVRRAPGHRDAVLQVAFSPDGRTAATAARDNLILVWDVARRAVLETLAAHSAAITGLAFSRDGRTLFSSGQDGKIVVWDVAGDRGLRTPFTLRRLSGAAISPSGGTLAVGHRNGTVTLIDTATLGRRTLRAGHDPLAAVAFTDGHHLLATVPRRGYGVILDTRSGAPGSRIPRLADASPPRVDAAGDRLALVWHGASMVQPLAHGRPAGRPRFYRRYGGSVSVDLSPDGRTLAVETANGVEIVDARTMRIHGFLYGSETASAPPRFVDGGRAIAVGSREGWVRVWSLATWRPISPVLAAHSGPVIALSVSADGATLASGGTDGFIRLFDLGSQQPLAARVPVPPNTTAIPSFGGAFLFATTPSGRAYRYDFRPASWRRRACVTAGRRLSREEWSEALPRREYAPACS